MISDDIRRELDELVERLSAAGLAAAVLVIEQSGTATTVRTGGIPDLPRFLRLFADSVEAKTKRGPAS